VSRRPLPHHRAYGSVHTCGLRRHEAVELNFGHIQQCEEHWAIVDLKGKAGHTRTTAMSAWVKQVLDQWLQAANII
jgi:site-specific recombinase XerD